MKRRKSSGKKRICVFLIAVVIGCTGIYLYYSMRRVNIRSVQEISIEYLDGHYVRSIVMEKKDAEKLAGIISGNVYASIPDLSLHQEDIGLKLSQRAKRSICIRIVETLLI